MTSSRSIVATSLFAVAFCACGTRTSLLLPGDSGESGQGGATASGAGGAPDGSVSGAGPDVSSSTGSEPSYRCAASDAPALLASIEWPIAMAQDAGHLYIASYAEDGGVYRVAKDGGATVLLADISWPSGVAVSDGWLYIASGGDRAVVRMPVAGGTVEHLADFFGPTDLVVEGDFVYVANYLDDEVAPIPTTGGSPQVLASGQNGVYRLALLDGHVGWGGFDRQLRAVPQAGESVVTLAPREARALTAFGDRFYATANAPNSGVVYRAGLQGGEEVLATDPEASFLEGIAADADHVYYARWTGPRTGGVARIHQLDGGIEPVFEVAEPIAIVLEDRCVYVTAGALDAASGAVYRLGVP